MMTPDHRRNSFDYQSGISNGCFLSDSHVAETQLFLFYMAQFTDGQPDRYHSLDGAFSDKLQNALHNRRGNRQLMHRIRLAFGVRRLAFGAGRLPRCVDIQGLSLARIRVELGFQRLSFPQRAPNLAKHQTVNAERQTFTFHTASKAAFTWSMPAPVLQLVGMTVISGFKR